MDGDFIGTLSDGDVSDEEYAAHVSLPDPQARKRKRETKAQSPVKKQKEHRDEDIESDFEFENEGGAAEMDVDLWALAEVPTKDVDIDKLVARRRGPLSVSDEGAAESRLGGDNDEVEESEGDEDDSGSSTDEEFHIAIDGLNGHDGSDASDDPSDEEDETESALPVAHPDDNLDSDASSDAGEDAAEKEKRDAFFANDTKPTSTTVSAFHSMNLSRPILKALASVGFSKPTPIQAKTIPVALEGKDLVGGAVTGSGKTAAFLLPILERLLFRPKRTSVTRVVILMPTRELALQCFQVAKKLSAFTDITLGQAIGGLNSREQEKQLKLRPDIVIATPGRFIDLERNSSAFEVSTIEILVLDEADRMLEEGFADELNEILSKISRSRQTMLFSATMTSKVDDLIRVGLQRPVRLMVDAQKQTVSGLTQEFVRLRPGREDKRLSYLMFLCQNVYTDRVIVFFRQKKEAHRVRVIFALCGLKAAELHGSMSQEQRINAMEAFRSGKVSYLLATDLASRGLDIKGIDTVINYEAPQSHEIYLHRVGRTARAGRSGKACTLAAEPDRKVVKAAVKTGKAQGAQIKQRTIDAKDADAWHVRLEAMQDEIEDVLREEKEERALQQTDRDLNRAENIVKYEDEIKARPKKTWFESEKDKLAAKAKGRTVLNGGVAEQKKEKRGEGKLSNKDKKRLLDRDDRRDGREWRKSKSSTLAGKEKTNGAKRGKKGKGTKK